MALRRATASLEDRAPRTRRRLAPPRPNTWHDQRQDENAPTMKVLVTDDDPDSRELVRLTLAMHGIQVIEASGGAECLKVARGGPARRHHPRRDDAVHGRAHDPGRPARQPRHRLHPRDPADRLRDAVRGAPAGRAGGAGGGLQAVRAVLPARPGAGDPGYRQSSDAPRAAASRGQRRHGRSAGAVRAPVGSEDRDGRPPPRPHARAERGPAAPAGPHALLPQPRRRGDELRVPAGHRAGQGRGARVPRPPPRQGLPVHHRDRELDEPHRRPGPRALPSSRDLRRRRCPHDHGGGDGARRSGFPRSSSSARMPTWRARSRRC